MRTQSSPLLAEAISLGSTPTDHNSPSVSLDFDREGYGPETYEQHCERGTKMRAANGARMREASIAADRATPFSAESILEDIVERGCTPFGKLEDGDEILLASILESIAAESNRTALQGRASTVR